MAQIKERMKEKTYFSSIENSYNREFMKSLEAQVPPDTKWVVQKTVHGANTSFLCDVQDVKFAKRASLLTDDGKFYDIPNLIERHKTRLFGCPVKNWMDDVKDSAMQQIENLCALPFLPLWTQEFNDYWAEMVYCVEFSLCNRHLMM